MKSKNTRYVVLGFPRSGTTLLARLLNGHPDVSCPPETFSFAAAGKFLSEQTRVEGPHIGVLSGLGMLGFAAEEVMAPLRDTVFGFQEKLAGERPIWVEKTATNIFHIETLEPFLAGHVRYIYIVRNPLDVVASNMDLASNMGAQLSDLHALTQGSDISQEGLMRAWIDRTKVLDEFAGRHGADCHYLRYEDLTENPAESLGAIMKFMGVEADIEQQISAAFSQTGRIGLGDFRIDETTSIRTPKKDGWRKRLPRTMASRIIPLAAELMEKHGYAVPKVPKLPDRETAIRQFLMAAELKRNSAKNN
ncbi:sulfotransferase family protein [Pseudorhodobacter aquimaris]|uniref:sulfotransferase family protein n=1 Tax=Pseudorhodobacter aquimaris TaxID=687412 RepID=UPI00067DA93A|nr:sulfotransferase [Pseudorhodobacter aquimaris]